MCSADRQWGCKEANNILGSREDKNPLKKKNIILPKTSSKVHTMYFRIFKSFEHIFTSLDKSEQFCTCFDKFWPIWTNLDKFKHI